jgi:hypothetical protein
MITSQTGTVVPVKEIWGGAPGALRFAHGHLLEGDKRAAAETMSQALSGS